MGKMEEASAGNGRGVAEPVSCGNAWTVEVASSPAALSNDCGGSTSSPPPLLPLGALLLEPPLPSWALITGVTTARPRVVVFMKEVRRHLPASSVGYCISSDKIHKKKLESCRFLLSSSEA